MASIEEIPHCRKEPGVPSCIGLQRDVRRALSAMAVLLAVFAGGACTPPPPGAFLPYPDTVYAPHPFQVDASLSESELREMYTVSPNRDPDGLGVLDTMELNSFITLMVKEMALAREEQNRAAYARSSVEHQAVMQEHEVLFRENVVFTGILRSDFAEGAKADWYLPEGVYLIDDRGRKFFPKDVGQLSRKSFLPRVRSSEFGKLHIGYPNILFPGDAIRADTRSITLYFANLQKRLSFTWIFDESYVPDSQDNPRAPGKGFYRMWRTR